MDIETFFVDDVNLRSLTVDYSLYMICIWSHKTFVGIIENILIPHITYFNFVDWQFRIIYFYSIKYFKYQAAHKLAQQCIDSELETSIHISDNPIRFRWLKTW